MADARITLDEVAHIAALARLDLSLEEKERTRGELDRVLGHMAELERVPIDGVEPMFDPVASNAGLREDVVASGLDPAEALASAPAPSGGCFSVPRIVEADR